MNIKKKKIIVIIIIITLLLCCIPIKYTYDVTEKTTYLITYTEITDDIGAKYITETVSPIK